jgi:hypothetical protein
MSAHHSSLLFASLLVVACSGEADGDKETETLPFGGSDSGGSAVSSAGTASGGSVTAGSDNGGSNSIAGSATGGVTGGASAGGVTGGSGGDNGGNEVIAGSAAGGQPYVPGPIDFRQWELQLPIGSGTSPTVIPPADLIAGFSNEYFYIAEDGGQAFMDPEQGVTTSGSTRCRSEMREQALTGKDAAWPSSGTHTMTVEGKVTKMGDGTIAIGQLFNGSDSIPLVELQYSTGHKFSAFYEEAKGQGSTIDLKTTVALNTKYTFQLAMIEGELRISINGKQVYSRKPSSGILDNQFYFKFGNYDQSTSRGTPTTAVYSVVEAYKVDLVHQ